ncbi:MAG: DUF4920 domain-containing protein [Bacteroidota bacterium]
MTIHRAALAALLILALGSAAAAGEKRYGKPLTLKATTPISSIMADPEKYDGKRVRVEGPVVDVCKKRGCWIMIGGDRDFEKIRFKVEDGVIIFPLDARGKTAAAEGIVSVTTYTVEELIEQGKHRAEENGTTFDPSSVEGPLTVVRIEGEGAVIR